MRRSDRYTNMNDSEYQRWLDRHVPAEPIYVPTMTRTKMLETMLDSNGVPAGSIIKDAVISWDDWKSFSVKRMTGVDDLPLDLKRMVWEHDANVVGG